jgi:VanZ family protein
MKNHILLLIILASLLILVPFFLIPSDLKTSVLNKIQLDTIGHIIGFFGLTWILVGLLKLPLTSTVICLFFYSALTELSQYYLGFRRGEFSDFVADVVGISLFAVIQWLIIIYGKPQKMRN